MTTALPDLPQADAAPGCRTCSVNRAQHLHQLGQTDGSGKQNDDFSTSNDFQRVDEFIEADDSVVIKALNSGSQDTWMHGGRNYPRKGR